MCKLSDYKQIEEILIRADCGHFTTGEFTTGEKIIELTYGADQVSLIFDADGKLTDIGE